MISVQPAANKERSIQTDSSRANTSAPAKVARGRYRWLRLLLRFLLVVVVFIFLLIALVSALLAFGSPYIGRYHAEIQARVSDYLGVPVAFNNMQLDWNVTGPRLEIDDVSVLAANNADQSIVQFDQIWIDLSLVKTFFTGGLYFNQLAVVGADLEIEYHGNRDIQIKGSNGFARTKRQNSSSGNNTRLAGQTSLDWLLRLDNAALLDSAVTIIDTTKGQSYRFESIDVEAENNGNSHVLVANISLPDSLGESLELTANIEEALDGRRVNMEHASGSVVLEGKRVVLENWLDLLPQQRLTLSGDADIRLAGQWSGDKVNKVDLELSSSSINAQSVDTSADPIQLDRLSSRLSWSRTDVGWVSDLDSLLFTYQGTTTDMRDGEFRVDKLDRGVKKDLRSRTWQAKLSGGQVDISALSLISVHVASLLPMGEFPSVLIDAQPGGLLTDWQLDVDRSSPASDKLSNVFANVTVVGELNDFSMKQSGSLPEISGLDAGLKIRDNFGKVEVRGSDFSFSHIASFSQPLQLESLQATLDVDFRGDARRMATDDLNIKDDGLSARLTVELDAANPSEPLLDINASYSLDDVTKVSKYLPRGKLRPRLTSWLDRSIKGGSATDGFLKLKGNPRNFPFHRNPGVFAATLKLKNAELEFLNNWPRMNRVDGGLTFSKKALVFELEKGRFGSLPLQSGTGTIETLFRPVVRVSAAAREEVDDLLNVVQQSPLQQVKNAIADTVGTGQADAHIELQIPLRGKAFREPDEVFDVSGYVQFDDNVLSSENYRTQFDQVNGRLGFTHKGLKRSTLRGRYEGQPVVVATESVGVGQARRTEMVVTGSVESVNLARQNNIPLMAGLSGSSPWKVEVGVPHDPEQLRRSGVSLDISSDLVGTTLNWPAPLGKASSSRLPLRVATRFGSSRPGDWSIQLGDRLQGLLRLNKDTGGLDGLTLKLGSESVLASDLQKGIHLSGRVESLAFDRWFRAVSDLIADIDELSDDSSDGLLPRVSAQLATDRLTTGSSSNGRASLRINSDGKFINAALSNQRIRGSVRIPRQKGTVLLRVDEADIDLLRELQTNDGTTQSAAIDPRNIPPLEVRLGSFKWGEVTLSNLVVRTEPDSAGMKIKTFGFAEETAQLTGDGFWRWQDPQNVNPALAGQQVTGLDLQVRSNNVGSALDSLGFSQAMAEGRGSIELLIGWSGPLYQPQLDKLNGSIDLDLRDGRILRVDPGIGRVLGLFALQSIPRRLSLDFKDFLLEGLEYTTIDGRVSFNNGIANSDLVQLRGPVGVIDVTGSSNLIDRSYDQTITVLPHLSGALPLIGIVTGGATAGIGALLAGPVLKALGIDVDQIGLSVFTLKGSWDSPNIQRADISSIPELPEFDRR